MTASNDITADAYVVDLDVHVVFSYKEMRVVTASADKLRAIADARQVGYTVVEEEDAFEWSEDEQRWVFTAAYLDRLEPMFP